MYIQCTSRACKTRLQQNVQSESVSYCKYKPECPVEVVTDSIHQISVGTWCTGNGAVPTVSNPTVNVSCVEHLPIEPHLKDILQVRRQRKKYITVCVPLACLTEVIGCGRASLLIIFQLQLCTPLGYYKVNRSSAHEYPQKVWNSMKRRSSTVRQRHAKTAHRSLAYAQR